MALRFLVFLLAALGFISSASAQDRSAEIWDHIDSRLIRELDYQFEDGNFPFVVDLLRVQLAYEPNNYETFTNLGWMLENIEREAEAEQMYADLRSQFPKNAEAAYPLGFFYYMKKRYAECIEVLEPTLSARPAPHKNTFIILAKSYERLSKFKEALRIWELQLKNNPGDGSTKVNIDRVKKKINP
jgi:tetratricopeptide (TPR) repeat protein